MMKNAHPFRWPGLLLGVGLMLGCAQAESLPQAIESPNPPAAKLAQEAVQTPASTAAQSFQEKSSDESVQASKDDTEKLSSRSDKRHVSGRLQKREMAESELLPAINQIMKLKWEVAPGQSETKISLEKVFHETLQHSIVVRQAQAQIQTAEAQSKDIRDPGIFNLLNPLNPLDINDLKKAADENIQAAQRHVSAVQQKALLESARMHADLVQTFLGKYLAFQAIEQGKRQLHAEQQRFISGDITSFDVTETQMALMDRYSKYLTADNTYQTASIALVNQLGLNAGTVLSPEDYVIEDENVSVSPLNLLPSDFSLDKARAAAKNRPEIQELALKKDVLSSLMRAATGTEKAKKQAELRQLELELEKAERGASAMAEKAYGDLKLATQNLELSRQRFEMANRFVHQLQVSHDAGFSSSKDVLDGQVEATKAKAALVSAQVAHNLSQIQLVYEMGLLNEDVLNHTIASP